MKKPQRGVKTRTENKLKRRQKLLQDACEMIADHGCSKFTLAALADKSEVTIPTIHNLLGKKSDVFEQLVEDMVTNTRKVLSAQQLSDPISAVEATVNNIISLYRDDEKFYKAAFVIGESEKLFEHETPTGIYKLSLSIAYNVCEQAKNAGYLIGNIPTLLLADKLFANQRLARHDWVNGYIDLEEYRTQVLQGMFITLAADATSEFHSTLMDNLNQL